MAEDTNGNPLAEDQNSSSGENKQNSNIPDWMREAGWEDDTGSFDESKPVFDNKEDEDDIVPAEIPAWLEEAAPEGFNLDGDSPLDNEGSEDKGSVQALIDDDFISSTADIATPPAAQGMKPDQPKKKSDSPKEPEIDIPSWLKNLELDEDSQETAVAWLENMPESLRATEEELEQSRINQSKKAAESADEPDRVDEVSLPDADPPVQAELSEDLVSADLIPEQQADDKLFATEELRSFDDDSPEWIDELSNEVEKTESPSTSSKEAGGGDNLMPDWLSELENEEATLESSPELSPQAASADGPSDSEEIPDWMGEKETPESTAAPDSDSSSLAWLESLAMNQGVSEEELITTPDEREQASPPISETHSGEETPADQVASPTDDTLNTEIPDWLSKIDDTEADPENSIADAETDENKFDESANWLEQLEDQPTGELKQEDPANKSEVMDWLEGMDGQTSEDDLADDLRESLTAELDETPSPPILETAKYMPKEDDSESMPDWLSELDNATDEESSLENALRQSGQPLNDDEQSFLDNAEEIKEDNADWLAKLDQIDKQQAGESDSPAIKVDLPQDDQPIQETMEEISVSGGILDRLKDTGAISTDPEVPQWLENLKKEEDPQETAILWLKQFVEQGDKVDLNHEIKRYTDELTPGNTVPAWMEDLKNEEDPQTTAMLWLEKLSGERPAPEDPKPIQPQQDDSDWLTALEKEEAEQSQVKTEQPAEDFQSESNGWLEDLDLDEKLKTDEEDIPDDMDDAKKKPAKSPDGETPTWLKATSPLEGDFNTDELDGDEKEVEIPDWLAGYGEGEEPEGNEDSLKPTGETDPDEYAWVSVSEDPTKPEKEPIDLNAAAISQLESILGISYQVARGIIRYREQNGPYQDLTDLLNVPEITDEQTIEILKPEVIIRVDTTQPKPVKTKKPKVSIDPEEMLSKARTLMAKKNITDSLAEYEFLIKKKKSLTEVIDDLSKAANDYPMDVPIIKTLGDAYMKINNLEAALESYSKAEDLLR